MFGLENRREPSLIVSSHIGLTAMGIRWEHNRSIGFLALRMPGGVWNCAGDVSKDWAPRRHGDVTHGRLEARNY